MYLVGIIYFLGMKMNIHTCIHIGEQYIQSHRVKRAASLSLVGLLGVRNVKGIGRDQVIENFVYHSQEFYFV